MNHNVQCINHWLQYCTLYIYLYTVLILLFIWKITQTVTFINSDQHMTRSHDLPWCLQSSNDTHMFMIMLPPLIPQTLSFNKVTLAMCMWKEFIFFIFHIFHISDFFFLSSLFLFADHLTFILPVSVVEKPEMQEQY